MARRYKGGVDQAQTEETMNKAIRHNAHLAGLATALLALTATFGIQSLWAAEPEPGYEMSYVSSQAHGDLMDEGRYRLVIHLLSGGDHDPVARMINRCVARTMIGDFRHARRDCTRAVELSEDAARAALESESDEHARTLAIALSNRGVLRAIRNQEGAGEDFTRAIGLQVHPETATRNLARLNKFGEEQLAGEGEEPTDQG
jgi:hypothetical protein